MSIWLEKRTVIAYALSLLALAEIIDLTIVSVAIPDLMGALGANINDIAITMTSYIIAAAICIPLTGLMTSKYGMRNVALASIMLFGIASILCGTATSLQEMIAYRLLQGIGGAFLPALAQSYVVAKFDPKDQPKIMTVITICIVLGPIIGPIMGGFIVQNFSWRWIFFVNIPICALGFTLIYVLMEKFEPVYIAIDYISFIFMAIGIGCIEYFVDEGNTNDWLSSFKMIVFLAIGIIFVGFFIWRGVLGKSVVDFGVFKNKNFVLACCTMFVFFSLLSGGLSYFSAMLQNVYGIPVATAGLLQVPRGIAAVISAPIYMVLAKKIDARILMSIAMAICGTSTLCMGFLGVDHNIPMIITLVVFQGIGMIGFFVLLMSVAYVGVAQELVSTHSGVFNFARNFSSSIGASLGATIIATQQQVSWHDLVSNISHFTRSIYYLPQSINSNILTEVSAGLVYKATILQSYIDMFYISGITMICLCWIPFLLKRPIKQITALH